MCHASMHVFIESSGERGVTEYTGRPLSSFLPRLKIADIFLACFLYEWAVLLNSVLIFLELPPELSTKFIYSFGKACVSLLQSSSRL